MKGCLLADDGSVTEYLNPASWEGQTRDGSRGQVMVELPAHYRKFETEGTIRRVKISEYPLPGYHLVPKQYVSAYEATVQRSTTKLCSVANSDADYRGGAHQGALHGGLPPDGPQTLAQGLRAHPPNRVDREWQLAENRGRRRTLRMAHTATRVGVSGLDDRT